MAEHKYYRLFKTQAEHDAAKIYGSESYREPWVGYTEQTDMVDYNFNPPPVVNDLTNYAFMQRLREKGVIGQDVTELYPDDCAAITSLPGGTTDTACFGNYVGTLEELAYFTGLENLPSYFAFTNTVDGKNQEMKFIFPPNVQSIGSYLLHDRQHVRGPLEFPEGLTTLPDCTIQNCYRLHQIILPSTITTISGTNGGAIYRTGWSGYNYYPSEATSWGDAKQYCGLTIICKAVTPPTVGSKNSLFIHGSYNWESYMRARTAIYVPDESVDAYKAASWWSTYSTYIKPMSDVGNAPVYDVNP
jgi:hypothetical protein